MKYLKINSNKKAVKFISAFLALTMVFLYSNVSAAPSNEIPEAVYSGISDAYALINNIDYLDVKASNTWAKEAIFETGALNIMKEYGSKKFGMTNTLTKEDAIADIYRAIGREADAQKAAEALDNARLAADKKKDPLKMWADGYLSLAATDGLISQQDLADALNQDQTTLSTEGFHRSAVAQRQDMAYWMAKALKLQTVYNQKLIFNSFNDWKKADPIKIPYIEAIVQNNIMNGDEKGNFNPTSAVTKEQTAQIIKNSEELILPILQLEKKVGTIEGSSNSANLFQDKGILSKTLNIRNSDGKLHLINIISSIDGTTTFTNENNGDSISSNIKDLIVYKNGAIGKSDLLKAGDRIEYLVAPSDMSVKFVKVISSIYDTKYLAAQINSVNTNDLSINVAPAFGLDYPDMAMPGNVSFSTASGVSVTYKFSNNVSVLDRQRKSDVQSLKPGLDVILTIQNNVVTEIRTFDYVGDIKAGVVKGIVEENNPQLGYITLYNEDGSGNEPEDKFLIRTFNYVNQNDLEAYKNHYEANIEAIKAGDTVFLKLDENGDIISASAVDNFTVKYGKVISKKAAALVVKYDDGEQQVLSVGNDVMVLEDNKPVSYSRLKDGDRVRLLLNITNQSTNLEEIAIEGSEHFISNIYKGIVSYIDNTSDKLVALNVESFNNGRWERDQKGIKDIKLADEYNLYFDNKVIDNSRANKYFKGTEAYFAVEKDYGGQERVVFVSFKNSDDTEDEPYDDSVSTALAGTEEFSLTKQTGEIKYGEGTIIVKDSRLVSGNSIAPADLTYVVANRSYDTGDYYAGVVQINERSNADNVQIYRARIKQINENKDFTVESFSQLKGLTWTYSNTPKTFRINYETRILDDSGVVSQRDFADFGDNSFKSRTVYVIANDTNATLVSTVPYGIYNGKGEINDLTGMTFGDDGSVLQEPTGLKLINAKVYDLASHMWVDSKDMTITLKLNSVILKDNKISKPSDLKKGDRIRLIKKDSTEMGDAYIIIVEN